MSTRSIRILGIDPSLTHTGIAVANLDLDTMAISVSDVDVIVTEPTKTKQVRKSSDDIDRASIMHRGIMSHIDRFKPSIIVAEMPSGTQSASGMKSNGICFGVLGSISNSHPITQVTPQEVKVAAVGSKTASKNDMIVWAYDLYCEAIGWLETNRKNEYAIEHHYGTGWIGKHAEHQADACGAIHAAINGPARQLIAALDAQQKVM